LYRDVLCCILILDTPTQQALKTYDKKNKNSVKYLKKVSHNAKYSVYSK